MIYTVIYYIICAAFLFIGLLAYRSPESLYYISPYYWYTDNEDAKPSKIFIKRTKIGGIILIAVCVVLVVVSIVLLILNLCGNDTVTSWDFIKSFVDYAFSNQGSR